MSSSLSSSSSFTSPQPRPPPVSSSSRPQSSDRFVSPSSPSTVAARPSTAPLNPRRPSSAFGATLSRRYHAVDPSDPIASMTTSIRPARERPATSSNDRGAITNSIVKQAASSARSSSANHAQHNRHQHTNSGAIHPDNYVLTNEYPTITMHSLFASIDPSNDTDDIPTVAPPPPRSSLVVLRPKSALVQRARAIEPTSADYGKKRATTATSNKYKNRDQVQKSYRGLSHSGSYADYTQSHYDPYSNSMLSSASATSSSASLHSIIHRAADALNIESLLSVDPLYPHRDEIILPRAVALEHATEALRSSHGGVSRDGATRAVVVGALPIVDELSSFASVHGTWASAAFDARIEPLSSGASDGISLAPLVTIEQSRRVAALAQRAQQRTDADIARKRPWRENDRHARDDRWASASHHEGVEKLQQSLDQMLDTWRVKHEIDNRKKYELLPERQRRRESIPRRRDEMNEDDNKKPTNHYDIVPDEIPQLPRVSHDTNDMLYRMMMTIENMMDELRVYNVIFEKITRPIAATAKANNDASNSLSSASSSSAPSSESSSSPICPSLPLVDLLDRIRVAHMHFYPHLTNMFVEIRRRLKFDWTLHEMGRKMDTTMVDTKTRLDGWAAELELEKARSAAIDVDLKKTKSDIIRYADETFFDAESINPTMTYDRTKRKLKSELDQDQIESLASQPTNWYAENDDEEGDDDDDYEANSDDDDEDDSTDISRSALHSRPSTRRAAKLRLRRMTLRTTRIKAGVDRLARIDVIVMKQRNPKYQDRSAKNQLINEEEKRELIGLRQQQTEYEKKMILSKDGGDSDMSDFDSDDGGGSHSSSSSPSSRTALSADLRLRNVNRSVVRTFTTRPLLSIRALQSGSKASGTVFMNSDYYSFELAQNDPGVWVRLFAMEEGSKENHIELMMGYAAPPSQTRRFFTTSTIAATHCSIDVRNYEMKRAREEHDKKRGRKVITAINNIDPSSSLIGNTGTGGIWYLRVIGRGFCMKKYSLEFRIQTSLVDYSQVLGAAFTDLETQSNWQATLNDKAKIVDSLMVELMPAYKADEKVPTREQGVQTMRQPPLPPVDWTRKAREEMMLEEQRITGSTSTSVNGDAMSATTSTSTTLLGSGGDHTSTTVVGDRKGFRLRSGLYRYFQFPRPSTASRLWHPKAVYKLITDIYAAKIVADSIDDRCRNPRQNLALFLIDHMKTQYGFVHIAEQYLWELIDSITTRGQVVTVSGSGGVGGSAGAGASSSASASSDNTRPTVHNSTFLYHFARLAQLVEPYLLDESVDWFMRAWHIVMTTTGLGSGLGQDAAAQKNLSKLIIDAPRYTCLIPIKIVKDMINELYAHVADADEGTLAGGAAVAAINDDADPTIAALSVHIHGEGGVMSSAAAAAIVAASMAAVMRLHRKIDKVTLKLRSGAYVDRDQFMSLLLDSSTFTKENYIPRLYNYWHQFNDITVTDAITGVYSPRSLLVAPVHHPTRVLSGPGSVLASLHLSHSTNKSWMTYHEFMHMLQKMTAGMIDDIECFMLFYKCLEWQNAPLFQSRDEQHSLVEAAELAAGTRGDAPMPKFKPATPSDVAHAAEVYRVSMESFVKLGYKYALLNFGQKDSMDEQTMMNNQNAASAKKSRSDGANSLTSPRSAYSPFSPKSTNTPFSPKANHPMSPTASSSLSSTASLPTSPPPIMIVPISIDAMHRTTNHSVPYPNHILTDDELNAHMRLRISRASIESLLDSTGGWTYLPDPIVPAKLSSRLSLKLFMKTFRYLRPLMMEQLMYVEQYCVSKVERELERKQKGRKHTLVKDDATKTDDDDEVESKSTKKSSASASAPLPARLEQASLYPLYDSLTVLSVADERAFMIVGLINFDSGSGNDADDRNNAIVTAEPVTTLTSGEGRLGWRKEKDAVDDNNDWNQIEVENDNMIGINAAMSALSSLSTDGSYTRNYDGFGGTDVDYEAQMWSHDWFELTGQRAADPIDTAASLAKAALLKSSAARTAEDIRIEEEVQKQTRLAARRRRALMMISAEPDTLVVDAWTALRTTATLLNDALKKHTIIHHIDDDVVHAAPIDPYTAPVYTLTSAMIQIARLDTSAAPSISNLYIPTISPGQTSIVREPSRTNKQGAAQTTRENEAAKANAAAKGKTKKSSSKIKPKSP